MNLNLNLWFGTPLSFSNAHPFTSKVWLTNYKSRNTVIQNKGGFYVIIYASKKNAQTWIVFPRLPGHYTLWFSYVYLLGFSKNNFCENETFFLWSINILLNYIFCILILLSFFWQLHDFIFIKLLIFNGKKLIQVTFNALVWSKCFVIWKMF